MVEPTVSGIHDLERIMSTIDHFGVPSLVAIDEADLNPARSKEIAAFYAGRSVEVVGRIPYDFRPSSPLCPLAGSLALSIRKAGAQVEGVTGQEIEVVGYVKAAQLNAMLQEPAEMKETERGA